VYVSLYLSVCVCVCVCAHVHTYRMDNCDHKLPASRHWEGLQSEGELGKAQRGLWHWHGSYPVELSVF
jgi:hypothetical protein